MEMFDFAVRPGDGRIAAGRPLRELKCEYECFHDGDICLIGGVDLPAGIERMRVDLLRADVSMTEAAMGVPFFGRRDSPGRGRENERCQRGSKDQK
jgi:hypothetical protein